MARLQAISSRLRSNRLVRPFSTALRTVESVVAVETELRFTDGVRSVGVAAPAQAVSGETAEACVAALEGPVAEAVRGLSRSDSEGALRRLRGATELRAARAAFDMAWQLASEKPVATREPVATDATVSLAPPASARDEATRHCVAGFSTLKLKVDNRPEVGDYVRAVVSELPGDCHIRLDPNQSWTATDCLELAYAMDQAGMSIDFIEQPLPAEDLAGMAFVQARSPIPLAADESARDEEDVHRLLDAGIQTFVLKSTKSGGETTVAAMVVAIEANAGRPIISTMMEPPAVVKRSATLAAKWAPDEVHDLDAALWFEGGRGLYRPPLVVAA